MLYFFFQAEDGIRDLVRSRGLGDVYKRQDLQFNLIVPKLKRIKNLFYFRNLYCYILSNNISAVSYTHLTLPTSDLV